MENFLRNLLKNGKSFTFSVFSGIWYTKIVKYGLAGQRDLLSRSPKIPVFSPKT